jgi:hypothetical protein
MLLVFEIEIICYVHIMPLLVGMSFCFFCYSCFVADLLDDSGFVWTVESVDFTAFVPTVLS